jgi:two-component system cell cycle sensor histidine kinase/response regulator CckA
LPPTTTARSFRTILVAGATGLAGGIATAWAHWLNPSMDVGMMPLAGIMLAALLLLEPRRWPLPLLAMAISVTGVGLLYDSDVATAVAPAAAVVIGSLLAASLLRVFAHGRFTLRRTVDVAALTVVGALGAFAGAAAGVALAGMSPVHGDYWATTARSGVAGWLGTVVVATVVLSWSTPRVASHEADPREAAILGVAVVCLGVFAFRVSSDPRSSFVVLILIWAAIRFRLRGVSTAVLAMVAIADWAVARHAGPLVQVGESTHATLLTFQTFAAAGLLAFLVVAAALDERDMADARRYIAQDRFRRTFESAPLGIAITTVEGIVEDANAALCGMLGYTRRELVGTELDSLRSRDDPSGELRISQPSMTAADTPAATERRYVSAHGERVWAEVSESQVRGPDGSPESGIVLLDDVTLRKDLEEQVLHAQKMDTVGRLAGGIAHDFNNLLAVMRGHAELMEADLAVIEQARQRLVSMQRATDRAAALTDDLLTFSRRSTDEPETIDVHEVVAAAHEMLAQLVGSGVTIDLQLEAESTRIDADPRRVEQVLVNLVVNASDAMPFGGRLAIATSNVFGPAQTDARPRALRIAVADTGTGITPQVQRRIFEPFFTTKAPGSGTGLGLSTADGVVRRYGGTIAVDSRLGEGTTFVITLPLSGNAHPPADAAGPPRPSGSDGAEPETILVVDDEPDVRANVAEVLRGCGYRVLEAANAGAALDLVSGGHAPIDLLLSDVVMPGMDGPELADRIRIHSPNAGVLFVSGFSGIEPTAACLRGAKLLRKPVPRAALIAEVEILLERHEGRIRARSGTPRPSP